MIVDHHAKELAVVDRRRPSVDRRMLRSRPRFERDGRAVIPFPHSSGVSRWSNRPENREKIREAVELLRAERERLS